MQLSSGFIDAHIARWESTLTAPFYPYRAKWPSRLFHHGPVENVAGILRDGNLRSRLDPENSRPLDIAGTGVIDTRQDAHQYARLYFRPRTPTQFHIEGIRKAEECAYGKQAPILIMLVFDARAVLSTPGIMFSDRNMQVGAVQTCQSEAEFSAIPFEKVFHEGGTGGDRSIIQHRCAEVLAMSPLGLKSRLQWIYCRSAAEKMTLLHFLGDLAYTWEPCIKVSNDLMVFDRRFTFVESVALSSNDLVIQMNPRSDGGKIAIEVITKDHKGNNLIYFKKIDMDPRPALPATRWRFDRKFKNGIYKIQINIEGHLAFLSDMKVDEIIF